MVMMMVGADSDTFAAPDAHPWRTRRTWRRAVAAPLLRRPYLEHRLCATEEEYVRARGGGRWRWQADVSYERVFSGMAEHLGADAFAWTRPSILRVLCNWAVVLSALAFLVYGHVRLGVRSAGSDARATAWACVWLPAAALATLYLASCSWLRGLRDATARHMAATAWLLEFAVRLQQPPPPGSAQRAVQMHAELAVVQEVQHFHQCTAALAWPCWLVAGCVVPRQAMQAICGTHIDAWLATQTGCELQCDEGGADEGEADLTQSMPPMQSSRHTACCSTYGCACAACARLWRSAGRLCSVHRTCQEAADAAAAAYGLNPEHAEAAAVAAQRELRSARVCCPCDRRKFAAFVWLPWLCLLFVLESHDVLGWVIILLVIPGAIDVFGNAADVFAQQCVEGRVDKACERIARGREVDPITAAEDCALAAHGVNTKWHLRVHVLFGPQPVWAGAGAPSGVHASIV